jgi:hypothetical protein
VVYGGPQLAARDRERDRQDPRPIVRVEQPEAGDRRLVD